jgi:uncharacterized protein with PIN domain
LQLSDKSHQAQDDAIVDDDLHYDGPENTAGTKDGNTEVKVSKVYPEEPEENDDITRYGLKVAYEVEEFTSDEGWQEANSKGRSAKTAGWKFGRRRPVLAKLNVSNGEHSNFKEIPEQKATPKINSIEFPLKQSKAGSLSSGEDSVNLRSKAPVSKVPTSPATLTSLASKSHSYKEVALAIGTKDGNKEVKVSKVYPEEPEENDDITRYGLKVACEVVEEFTSDEGWQEANSKGRSAKTAGWKFGRRRPVLAKLNVSNGEHSNFKEIIYRRNLILPEQKATPKINSTEFPLKQSKAGSLSSGEDSVNLRSKAPVSKVPTSPATLTSLASKSHSYKEVALASPGTKDGNTEVKVSKVYPEEPEENDDITRYGLKVASEVVEEFTSDEGWQEANSKGRSAKTAGRKFGRRRPVLAKLNVSNGEHSNFKEIPEQKATPKINSIEFPLKQSKAGSLSSGEDSVNLRSKAPVSKVPTSPATLTSLASKSHSYKEVALAPPGTILKPLLEKVEELNEEKTEASKDEESSNNSVIEAIPKDIEIEGTNEKNTQMEPTTPKLEEVSCSSDQVKPVETKGSKLSAAAEPFNPGSLSMPHHLNSVSVTSVYDVNVSQGMLAADPVLAPVVARIPCGPRSPLYHRNNYSFRMKHGHSRYHTSSKERGRFGSPRIMNPHAPEFVPGRAWQTNPGDANCPTQTDSNPVFETSRAEEEKLDDKSNNGVKDGASKKSFSGSEKLELARQILLSFIVKSVRHNMDPVGEPAVSEKNFVFSENSSDAIANDSAIMKILYGNEGKKDLVSQSCDVKEPKTADANKKQNGDGEGFTVVRKRRRNRQQFTNSVTGLYNQQSICASVR